MTFFKLLIKVLYIFANLKLRTVKFFEPQVFYQSWLKVGCYLSLLAVISPGWQPSILAGSQFSWLTVISLGWYPIVKAGS